MYSIFIKASGSPYEKRGSYSLANVCEVVYDGIIDIIAFHRGYDHMDFFLKEHPQSTVDTPSYYCIVKNNKYVIYKHKKISHMFSTEHVYEKKYTIKIIREAYEPIIDWTFHLRNLSVQRIDRSVLIAELHETIKCLKESDDA